MSKKSLYNAIIGTWLLHSICQVKEGEERTDVYGLSPMGILMYSVSGYMNAQLGYRDRAHMSSGEIGGGTAVEKALAFDNYIAYYGKFFEKEPGTIIHEVEGCTIPNWVGQQEVRYATVKDNQLHIRTPETVTDDISTYLEVIWIRA